MSGPSGGGNTLDKLGKNIEQGGQDLGTGLEQIGQGNVSQGVTNSIVGNAAVMSYGLTGLAGISGKAKADEVANQTRVNAANDTADNARMNEQARLDRIQTRLKEEVKLRQKSPGKAQTLLTSSLTPNSQMTGTLLTGRR